MSIKFLQKGNWITLFGEYPPNYLELINLMVDFLPPAGVFNRERLCHFLAQLAHETGGFKWNEELASGSQYEGRKDLGNIYRGDGVRYKGRGYIQLTGRANYRLYGQLLGLPLEDNPDLAKQSKVALKIALTYWNMQDCNFLADKGDFEGITRKINGGLNGLEDRWRWLNRLMTLYDQWIKKENHPPHDETPPIKGRGLWGR